MTALSPLWLKNNIFPLDYNKVMCYNNIIKIYRLIYFMLEDLFKD